MGKKLLFIDDSHSFIIKSIMGNLEKHGLHCENISLTVNDIEAGKDEIDGYVFVNITDVNSINKMGITYLRDICIEKGYKVFFMGYKEDIDEVRGDLFPADTFGEFIRPLNAQQITESIITMKAENPDGVKKKHILVVDDSGTMLTTIQSWLSDKYMVSMVNSAMNAFTFLATQHPDLILLDYEMPVCTGAQFLGMLRNDVKTESIPVIFLTGKGDPESVKSVLALKPAGYLLKTMPKEHIVGEVDAFFAKQSLK